MGHCTNLASDREVGAYWERQFCVMARDNGFMFSPLQIGRDKSAVAYKGRAWNVLTLPDVVIWTFPGQHHEIKHKNPTRRGEYGLERYRFDALRAFALETEQDVLYTIHNHDLAGGRDVKTNDLAHWFTARIVDLDGQWSGEATLPSWVNGKRKQVPIYFWPQEAWTPLACYWASVIEKDREE